MTDEEAFDWAWSQFKKDYDDEKWTAGEEIHRLTIFRSGWNYRSQLVKQRPAEQQSVH
jgi:hypothetical protein